MGSATVALVGRPNVGKSTLFNRLTGSRAALVADLPGLTRDRLYGRATLGEHSLTLIDTGGLGGVEAGIDALMAGQAAMAIEEADLVLFLVDARAGVTAADEQIAVDLRRANTPHLLVVNKCDGADELVATAEFHQLGLGDPVAISASHGRGIANLRDAIEGAIAMTPDDPGAGMVDEERITVAIIGRPNVGKSTLVNRLLGDDRVVVFDQPGTTRDAIYVPMEHGGRAFTLVDTAGVRRRGRVSEAVEKFSIVKTLESIRLARVVLLVIDAQEGLVEQDLHLLGHAMDTGRSILLVVNKWDGLDPAARRAVRAALDRRMVIAPWVEIRFISALHGSGVGDLLPIAAEIHASGELTAGSSELTRILEQAIAEHPPPQVRGRRIKLRFAHPGGSHPPTVVVHGNQTAALPDSYRRYLANTYREQLGLRGTPVRVEFRTSSNPFAGRRNPLTPRQQRRRKRLLRHVKRR